MADLTLLGMRVVREVAARGSFTAAAKSLGYTQSAVSRQVAAMELAAGAPLFERIARGVRPTQAGETLLRHARVMLDASDAAGRELAGLRQLASGRLRTGAFPTAMAALLPGALAAFRSRYPGVRVSVREGTTLAQLRKLAAGASDIAVVGDLSGQSLNEPGVDLEPLVDDPLFVAVSQDHRLARQRSVSLDELAGEAWIAGRTKADGTLLDLFFQRGWQPQIEIVAREWTAKLGLVAAGLGVTLVPGLAVDAVGGGVSLIRVNDEDAANRRVYMATRSGTDPTPQAQAFADLLRQTAADLAT